MADLTDEEVSHWIEVVWQKAQRAAAGGSLDNLRACVFGHGYRCDEPACELSWAPPAA